MSQKTTTRISLDIPTDYHKQLKAVAALQGKTLRQVILESLEECILGQVNQLEIPEHERWVYDPTNKEIVEHIKEGLKQKATIYRGSFSKSVK